MSFDQFDLDERCLRVLHKQNLTIPTPVQAAAIPLALEGKDVLAIAQTGTGKTLAFSLPAMSRLAQEKPGRNRMLVLTPTRELAVQVHSVIAPLAKALGRRTACIYGGVGMEPQVRALRHGVDIIIATPGRLQDHIDRGNCKFPKLQILVLDEADRMLDMGFLPAIRRIVGELPKERQTLLFSATFPKEISGLTREFMHQPERIELAPSATPAEAVRQNLYTVASARKMTLLAKVLKEHSVESAIVFIRTKHRTERVAKALQKDGFHAEAIHGGRSQAQRQKALEAFRKGRCKILVATDVAARGIDVQGITHVLNFDIPKTFDDYVHRIGRTARANAEGDAITFVSPEEHAELRAIERGLGKSIQRIEWEGAVPVISAMEAERNNKKRTRKPRNFSNRNRRGFGRAAQEAARG